MTDQIYVAVGRGRNAFADGDMQTALRYWGEVLESDGYVATEERFLKDLLAIGNAGMNELIKYRDVAEAKIESGKAEHMDICRWQAFNEALNEKSDIVQFYERMAGSDARKAAPRLIAIWTIVDHLNKQGRSNEAIHYVEEFANELADIRKSLSKVSSFDIVNPKRREELPVMGTRMDRREQLSASGFSATGRALEMQMTACACVEAALATENNLLAERLVDDLFNSCKAIYAYCSLEELIEKYPGLSLMLDQSVQRLAIKDQIELAITRCLFEIDLEGLIIMPEDQKDEYEDEAEALMPYMHHAISESELTVALEQVWSYHFGRECELLADGTFSEFQKIEGYQPPNLRPTARDILKTVQPLLAQLPSKPLAND